MGSLSHKVNLILVLLAAPICSVLTVMEYHQSSFENKKMTDTTTLLETTSDRTPSQCLEFCSHQPLCMSYFYNTNSRDCHIHSIVFADPTSASFSQENGWKYYQVYDNVECPPATGYLHNRGLGLCYKYTVDPDTLNVTEFRLICTANNAELIAVTSVVINDHLISYLNQFTSTFVLIQGTDLQTAGTWLLDDGTPLTYFNWGIKQPSTNPNYNYLYFYPNRLWGSGAQYYGASGAYICNKKLQ